MTKSKSKSGKRKVIRKPASDGVASRTQSRTRCQWKYHECSNISSIDALAKFINEPELLTKKTWFPRPSSWRDWHRLLYVRNISPRTEQLSVVINVMWNH